MSSSSSSSDLFAAPGEINLYYTVEDNVSFLPCWGRATFLTSSVSRSECKNIQVYLHSYTFKTIVSTRIHFTVKPTIHPLNGPKYVQDTVQHDQDQDRLDLWSRSASSRFLEVKILPYSRLPVRCFYPTVKRPI